MDDKDIYQMQICDIKHQLAAREQLLMEVVGILTKRSKECGTINEGNCAPCLYWKDGKAICWENKVRIFLDNPEVMALMGVSDER